MDKSANCHADAFDKACARYNRSYKFKGYLENCMKKQQWHGTKSPINDWRVLNELIEQEKANKK